jgi:hypothetical protein
MSGELPVGWYANAFHVGYNAFEIVLDFGQLFGERQEAQIHSRIVTGPTYAKVLFETLRGSLARYEETYGAIEEAGRPSGATPTSYLTTPRAPMDRAEDDHARLSRHAEA